MRFNPFRAPQFDDAEATRVAGVLAPLLTLLTFGMGVTALSTLAVGWILWWQVVGISMATVLFAALRWAVERGYVRVAANVTTGAMCLISVSSLVNDGSPAVFPVAFALVIVFGGLTIRWPGPLWLGSSAAVTILGVHLAHASGALTLRRPPEEFGVSVTLAVSMLVLAAAIHWANESLTRARARATAQEATSRRLEQSLYQAQRMEAIGRLAGGVAHDFNNLLSVVLGNASLLAVSPGATDEDRQSCEAIIKAGEGGAHLARQLLAFGRRDVRRPVTLDLGEAIRDFAPVLSHMAKSASLSLGASPDGACVEADPAQLQHAVANLVLNAVDASPPGGPIGIVIEKVELAAPRHGSHSVVPAGEYLVLRVQDEGSGMEPATVAEAFDPFFTSRRAAGGSGLGLAVVHGFTQQSGGHAEIESRLGGGTTVSLWLPRVDAPPQWRPPIARDSTGETLAGTQVLLVDDDEGARRVIRMLLERAGATVHDAPNADGALAYLDRGEAIDIAVLDVLMPGMSGPALATVLRERGVHTPVIFLTGYADPARLRSELGPRASVLYKPVSTDALVAEIAARSGRGRSRGPTA